jgi:adenylate cyclase class 2
MEIEIKAKLKDKDVVMAKLKALGCEFSPVKTQDDMVWVKETGSLDTFLGNAVFMRIRVQDGKKVIMTAKQSKTNLQGGAENLVKREHEVVVDSAEDARGILAMLGLKEAVRAVKKRQTAHYKDFEICVDNVEGLGSFIELEKIADEKDAAQIQKEMSDFLQSLGVSPEDQVHKGYDILMLEKQTQ